MANTPHKNVIEYILMSFGNDSAESNTDNEFHELYSSLSEELRFFLDQIPGGFLVYHADGAEKIIYANEAMFRIMGCENEKEFRKHTHNSFRGLVHPDDLENVEAAIVAQIAASQYDLDYVEYRIIRKDGQVRWIEDYGHYLTTETMGNIYYVFLTDATEKIEKLKTAEAEILTKSQEKDKKIESLVEEYDNERKLINQKHLHRLEVIEGLSIDYESVLYVNLDTSLVVPYRLSIRTEKQFDGRLVEENFENYTRDYVNSWVHPEDKKTVMECMNPTVIKERLQNVPSFYINYRCIYYGEIQNIQMRVVSVDKTCSQIVLGYRNITDEILQTQTQKQILEDALENAKQASAVKDLFLANMSHEMRTPLNAIFGYIKLARQNPFDVDSVNNYLGKIESSAQKVYELIEKVLMISQTQTQNKVVEKDCNLVETVSDVCGEFLPKARRKNIVLSFDVSGVTDVNVTTDEEKLRQILTQLVDNAIKYTLDDGHGRVIVVVSQEKITPNGHAVYTFTVTDNGMGIKKDKLKVLFDPFERESSSTTSGHYGMGLGLTIAQNYANTLGGNIRVTAEEGRGSTFTFSLTFRVRTVKQQVDSATLLEEIKKQTILIVDDNEINMEIESELLEELGFKTEPAENGQICLDKLLAHPVDYYSVVLMDIQMPVMDGWEATKQIRNLENKELSKIPVIAVSANSFESDINLSMQSGMDAHLPKPLDVQLLLETIAKILAERK